MRFKIFTLLFILCFGSSLYSQELNAYKYVIIPTKFDFQKSNDQYQLNSLSKFLFKKKGMVAFMDNEKQPQDLYDNPCLALRTEVIENSNLFTTKLVINLSDCRNSGVFTSEEGRSKLKDFKKGHQEALRKAFRSIQAIDYSFDQSLAITRNTEIKKTDVETVPVIINEDPVAKEPELKSTTEVEETKVSAEEIQSVSDAQIVEYDGIKVNDSTKLFGNNNILYAQIIPNGYQLVDSSPKIIFKAFKSQKDENIFYLANKAGILYHENATWYVEYYKDGELVVEKLNIKF